MKRAGRRDFLKAAGMTAAVGATKGLKAEESEPRAGRADPDASGDKYPKLSIITRYSPAKLAFAAATGYEGVVIPLDDFFDPDKLSDSQIDQILAAARNANIRIISIECMWGLNHIAKEPTERKNARAKFVRCLEFGHRLGCKFVGTFTGGIQGAKPDDEVKELAAAINEEYLPVCEQLDLQFGPENYPCP